MLDSRLGGFEGLLILDLFAGSGALALEALSRGAARAWLAESGRDARAAIEANIRMLGADARLVAADATALPPAPAACHLLFLDPPYGSGLWAPALAGAAAKGWVAPGAVASIETARDEEPAPDGWEPLASRHVGKARLSLMRAPLPA